MARSADEIAVTAEFEGYYQVGAADIMRRVERSVCGCDYGSTSWTTRRQAEIFAAELALGVRSRLLDLGAGAGWPSLYMARLSGCSAVLVDLPPTALRLAKERASADGLAGRVQTVAAEAGALPFDTASFDAICHSDVLCCLEDKRAALASCRQVIRDGGRMAFTVISPAEQATAADLERLDGAGPPFAATAVSYPALLAGTGWQVVKRDDWSEAYAATIRRLIIALETEASAVCAVLGTAVFDDKMATQYRAVAAIEAGVLRRDLFVAIPASDRN